MNNTNTYLLYRTPPGTVVQKGEELRLLNSPGWNTLLNTDHILSFLHERFSEMPVISATEFNRLERLSMIQHRELWGCGVTYLRSKTARMEESEEAGGGDFYDRVYQADRPEIFFKATPERVRAPGQPVRIRRDSRWNVPEPEIVLVITDTGRIIGYTIGNDMSSRDIEGENPLYLPQAKTWDGCAALGPAVLISDQPLDPDTNIQLRIYRKDKLVSKDEITFSQMIRRPEDLVSYLFRECSFPHGVFLLTGTGIIPPDDFSLQPGDRIEIEVDGIGTLVNPVERLPL